MVFLVLKFVFYSPSFVCMCVCVCVCVLCICTCVMDSSGCSSKVKENATPPVLEIMKYICFMSYLHYPRPCCVCCVSGFTCT